jgi:UDP-glucose 4-epimerase
MKCRLTGSRSAISHAPERPGDVKHSLASTGKLRSAGYASGGNFNAGLQATLAFFKQPQT